MGLPERSLWQQDWHFWKLFYNKHGLQSEKYLLLTEFEGRTVSYGPSFFLLDLWPKREARGP